MGREPSGPGRRRVPAWEPGSRRPGRGAAGRHLGRTRRSPNPTPRPQAPPWPGLSFPAAPGRPRGSRLTGRGRRRRAGILGQRSVRVESGAADCRPTAGLRTARAPAPLGAREEEEAPPSPARRRPRGERASSGAESAGGGRRERPRPLLPVGPGRRGNLPAAINTRAASTAARQVPGPASFAVRGPGWRWGVRHRTGKGWARLGKHLEVVSPPQPSLSAPSLGSTAPPFVKQTDNYA